MKINKHWEPRLEVCPACKKEFEVKYEICTNDNCIPVLTYYNFERIFRGHVEDESWADEEMLQWINITDVLFMCPHCCNSFGSNENCTICFKPVHHWLGPTSGYTCSEKCYKIYWGWMNKGGLPRKAIVYRPKNNDDTFMNTSRRRSDV